MNKLSDSKWLCTKCQSKPSALIQELLDFYRQYQSDYCDFKDAYNYVLYLMTLLDPKAKIDETLFTDENRTWLHRDITFNPEYSKAIFLKVTYICELPDLFNAMKDILILVACKSKLATMRSKALKAIKAVIKTQPSLLLDVGVQNLLTLRISDNSTVTREAAVDLLLQYLNRSNDETK